MIDIINVLEQYNIVNISFDGNTYYCKLIDKTEGGQSRTRAFLECMLKHHEDLKINIKFKSIH